MDGISPASGSSIFNEELVEEVFFRVGPAVVEVYSDLESEGSFVEITSGSGFLIDDQGYIITNNHVVKNGDRIRISLYDGTNTEAVVIGRSLAHDVALLKVDPQVVAGITPVEMGDSDLVHPGQLAIVIGSPFGLKNSVSVGVNSGVNRGLPSELGRLIPGMLQTDALISPGNSGGPMLNSAGQVVGITTAIELSSAKITQRIGFAVPINTVRDLLPQLKGEKVVGPPWLGTHSQGLKPLLVERLALPVEHGFYVTQITPDSPAAQAGLIASGVDGQGRPAAGGDIIVAVNGVPVQIGAEMTAELSRNRPGDAVVLTVVRGSEEMQLTVTLGNWPGQIVMSEQLR
ncbi:MAG: trypsin-like peptidase domain-containing protein [Chloroflexi bacterium]|nr:trypsin-like peptidase domain-containing protein [Chloroflexota bacterium]